MRLELAPESRVFIDLRATGLLRGVGHDPTLSAPLGRGWAFETRGGPPFDAAIELVFASKDIEPPADLAPADRDKMRDNLRSAEVLDAARFPEITFRGRYAGSLEEGRLSGELVVRGEARSLLLDLTASRSGDPLEVRGQWEGRLTALGIKPYRALLGALRLEDWIRIRPAVTLLVADKMGTR